MKCNITTMLEGTTDSSTRGASRKNRVYVFREWLLETYGTYLLDCHQSNSTDCLGDEDVSSSPMEAKKRKRNHPLGCGGIILDVAGGKGDLSWLLKNVDGLESIVVDPWKPNPKSKSRNARMTKSIEYLRKNPEEAEKRSIPFLPTYQPLATLIPKLMLERHKRLLRKKTGRVVNIQKNSDPGCIRGSENSTEQNDCLCPDDFLTPRVLHVPLDENMVKQVQARIETYGTNNDSFRACHDGKVESNNQQDQAEGTTIEILSSGKIKLIVGFHPDQGTEPCIDLARVLNVPFCVVPCCVFPSEFPNRRLVRHQPSSNEKQPEVPTKDSADNSSRSQMEDQDHEIRVRTYAQFLEYLKQKAVSKVTTRIKSASLDFPFTETAKNIVLYTLPPSC